MESHNDTSNSNNGSILLQSDKLSVEVCPDLGAMISSLIDCRGNQYLADALHPRPSGLGLNAGYNDGGLGGIDDCLPAIGMGFYPTEPFKGWLIPDHGEVWMRPWEAIQVNSQEAILLIRGVKLPYSFTRRMVVDDAGLRLEYSLTNHSSYDLPIVWASHPMLRITPETKLDIGVIEQLKVEASNFGVKFGEQIPYPFVDVQGVLVDLRQLASLPEGTYLKAFALHPKVSTVNVFYPEWNSLLRIKTHASRPIYIGVWLNKLGFPVESPVEHISIEPTFGSSDSLEHAYRDGSCLVLGAHTTEEWVVEYQVIDQTSEGN